MEPCWRVQGRLTDSTSVAFTALATRYQTVAGTVGGAAADVRCTTHLTASQPPLLSNAPAHLICAELWSLTPQLCTHVCERPLMRCSC